MSDFSEARTRTLAELSALPATDLLRMQADAAEQLTKSKALKNWIDCAIALKYDQRIRTLRGQLGKDTGIVNLHDDGVHIAADLPKKPIWDQQRLAEIAERIRASGDNPADFLDISYKVAERQYTAWPEHLRSVFAPARTVQTGKPVFKMRPAPTNPQPAAEVA